MTCKKLIKKEIDRLENEIFKNMLVPNWTEVNVKKDLILNGRIVALERLLSTL